MCKHSQLQTDNIIRFAQYIEPVDIDYSISNRTNTQVRIGYYSCKRNVPEGRSFKGKSCLAVLTTSW